MFLNGFMPQVESTLFAYENLCNMQVTVGWPYAKVFLLAFPDFFPDFLIFCQNFPWRWLRLKRVGGWRTFKEKWEQFFLLSCTFSHLLCMMCHPREPFGLLWPLLFQPDLHRNDWRTDGVFSEAQLKLGLAKRGQIFALSRSHIHRSLCCQKDVPRLLFWKLESRKHHLFTSPKKKQKPAGQSTIPLVKLQYTLRNRMVRTLVERFLERERYYEPQWKLMLTNFGFRGWTLRCSDDKQSFKNHDNWSFSNDLMFLVSS